MSLLNPALLLGLMAIALPILLHLLMQSKPKEIVFPALRLIQLHQVHSQRRIQLRHFWVLLLRAVLIGLFVLAIARPTVPAANYGLNGWELGALIAVMVGALAIDRGATAWMRRQPAAAQSARTARLERLHTMSILGAIALALLLVAWPYHHRVRAELATPNAQAASFPVASVLIFDSSPSMGYQESGQTRLERSKSMALELIDSVPAGSRVAISVTADPGEVLFQADLAAARLRLAPTSRLTTEPVSYPLNQVIRQAIATQRRDRDEIMVTTSGLGNSGGSAANVGIDRFVREVYVFTDVTTAAWNLDQAAALREDIASVPWLNFYIVDVRSDRITNFALGEISLGAPAGVAGLPLGLDVTIDAQGMPADGVRVELTLRRPDGSEVVEESRDLNIPSGESQRLPFQIRELTAPFTSGQIRLISSDPLAMDDVRHFTIAVEPPPQVLVVADRPQEAFPWTQALAPDELVQKRRALYDVTSVATAAVTQTQMDAAEVICLINVRSLSAAQWKQLADAVDRGARLVVVLGSRGIDQLNYQREAKDLLPAVPQVFSRPAAATGLDLADSRHLLVTTLQELGASSVLSDLPVRQFWKVQSAKGAVTVAEYANSNDAALVTGVLGQGRVAVLTTGVDLVGGATGDNWSDLPRGGWAFVAFADQLLQFLLDRTGRVYQYQAGQEVLLDLPASLADETIWLQLPDGRQFERPVPYRAPLLSVTRRGAAIENERPASEFGQGGDAQSDVSQPPAEASLDANEPADVRAAGATSVGTYRVSGGENRERSVAEASVNIAAAESLFDSLSLEQLDELLGEGRYQRVTTLDDLERKILEGRLGKELFPLLMIVTLVLFCGEQTVANWFYGREPSAAPVVPLRR